MTSHEVANPPAAGDSYHKPAAITVMHWWPLLNAQRLIVLQEGCRLRSPFISPFAASQNPARPLANCSAGKGCTGSQRTGQPVQTKHTCRYTTCTCYPLQIYPNLLNTSPECHVRTQQQHHHLLPPPAPTEQPAQRMKNLQEDGCAPVSWPCLQQPTAHNKRRPFSTTGLPANAA
jgi:hypothetical protein